MPMREDCRHFQSRTYASGEVARICVLDLAPEAPWRCPEDCPRYELRTADAGWTFGSLVHEPVEAEPDEPSGDVAELLDAAEEIVNAVVPSAIAEVSAERADAAGPWRRLGERIRRLRRGRRR